MSEPFVREQDRQAPVVGAIDTGPTRRTLLRNGALGGGALVAGGALFAAPTVAVADTTSDLRVLNFALTLEHLEATFYTDGLQHFSRADFDRARHPGIGRLLDAFGFHFPGFGGGRRRHLYDYLKLIREHEQTHVDALTSVISSLGGTPVPRCKYNFETTAYTSVKQFLSVAQALENTGVNAYDGAIHLLNGSTAGSYPKDLLTTGATIATVEARHASYLNLVNGDVPFPAAFDTPKLPSEICKIAGQFIVSCPYSLSTYCMP